MNNPSSGVSPERELDFNNEEFNQQKVLSLGDTAINVLALGQNSQGQTQHLDPGQLDLDTI